MRSIALALGASLTWGFADFFGALKGRTLAAVPVIFGIATGDGPSLWQWLGIAGALGGVFLASREPGRGVKVAAGVGLALLAAIGFGVYFPPMHAAGNADYWWGSLML